MPEPTCAVIVPTLNEADHVGVLIDSIHADRYEEVRVIVVDGGSTDGTQAQARAKGATVIEEEADRRSPASARNQGARYAIETFGAEVLCFLDGDLELSPDFIHHGMKHFVADRDVVAVRSVADAVRDTLLMKVYSPVEDMSVYVDGSDDAPPPPAVFYRAQAFEAVGGYEQLGFREDWVFYNEIREYARAQDMEIVFEPECVRFGQIDSFGEFLHQQRWYGRTFLPYVRYVGVKDGIRDLFLLSPLGFLVSLLALLAYPLTSELVLLALGLPFVVKLGSLVHQSAKHGSPYVVPHFFLDVVGNLAFIVGIGRYLLGDARLSRG